MALVKFYSFWEGGGVDSQTHNVEREAENSVSEMVRDREVDKH